MMRKNGNLLMVFLIAATLLIMIAQPAASVPNSSVYLYLPLNGTAGVTTNIYDLSSANRYVWNPGFGLIKNTNDSFLFGNSYYMNGTEKSALHAYPFNLSNSSPWSISFWFNTTTDSNYCAVGSRNMSSRGNGEFCFGHRQLSVYDSGDKYTTYNYGLADGKWHFFNFQRDNATEIVLYVDGVYKNHLTISSTDKIGSVTRNFSVGRDISGYMTMNIEDVLVINQTINGTIRRTEFLQTLGDAPPVSSYTASNTSGAHTVIAAFTDTSSGTPATWGWNATCLENETTTQFSTEQNPVQIFDVGHWLISLVVTNAEGQDFSDQVTWVNVSSEITPLAIYSQNKTVVLFPGYVGFTDLSTNTPTAWEWSFGDGTYATTRNATHQFTKRGRWTILLNASNSAGYSLNTSTVTVLGG